MAVTITATKYFTGTGPIKFSEIRDTFGDLPGDEIRLSDYRRNSTTDIDWDEDSTISPRVPDATENSQLSDTKENIKLNDYRNTILEYIVTQTGTEEERVYSDGNEAHWNNNLSKNVNKDYNVNGTIYANETNKYALTFEEGNYNNLYINVTGNIYGEGGAVGGGNGGGALFINNKYDGDKVRLSIANNGKIWAGGGGGVSGNSGADAIAVTCQETVAWVADNKVGSTFLCNDPNNAACNRPIETCKGNTAKFSNRNNVSNNIIDSTINWTSAQSINRGINKIDANGQFVVINLGTINIPEEGDSRSNRSRCRSSKKGGGIGRGGINVGGVVNYAARNNAYQCTTSWRMRCEGKSVFTVNPTNANKGGTGGTGGSGKGFTNRNVSINSAPHVGTAGNPAGNCVECTELGTKSCPEPGNPGNRGGDWGQAATVGGSGGIAIRKKRVIVNNANANNVKGAINNI